MANEEHLRILRQGVEAWNNLRQKNSLIKPDLFKAKLRKADLRGADLSGAILVGANLSEADLSKADLSEANLGGANLRKANLTGAKLVMANLWDADLRRANLRRASVIRAVLTASNLSRADLREAYLGGTGLNRANLSGANLSGAVLDSVTLVETNLKNTDLTGCHIYGISAWNSIVDAKTKQSGLIITRDYEPTVTVDDLEVAQFIYLLLSRKKLRNVIDTITTKVVLILGRFTAERKAVLNAIGDELRRRDYIPVLFDFDKPESRDTHETITTLARLARYIIADITSPKSIPQELVSIAESLPSLPIQPLLKKGQKPWGMFDHIKKYPWVLALHRYKDLDDLLLSLKRKVIEPAEAKVKEIREGKVK